MKINIEKLPSGRYRIRKTVRGKTYRLQLDYKPTQREALELLSALITDGGSKPVREITFAEAMERHLETVGGVLSPSTLRAYRQMQRKLQTEYGRFCALRLPQITQEDVQRVISDHARNHAPKTTANLNGFISVVLRAYNPSLALHVTVPPRKKTEPHIPTDAEVRVVCEALRGTKYEVPVALAALGLRRSEICGLSLSDLTDDNRLHIHRARIQTEDGSYRTVDRTKTPESTRTIMLPEPVADLIRARGCIYDGSPCSITVQLRRVQARLGIPRFSVHKLRHYYASTAHALGVPDVYIMAAGGWKTDNVLKAVYRHAMDDRRAEMDRRALEHIATVLE